MEGIFAMVGYMRKNDSQAFQRVLWVKLLLLTVIACGVSVGATLVQAETLKAALRAAYENNPELLAERARQRADDEAVPQALSGWRPTVSLDGGVGREKRRTSPPSLHTDLDPSDFGISLSQPLFSGFRTINSTRRAKAQVRAGQETLFDKEQNILLSAVTAYMDVIRDRRLVKLQRDNVSFLGDEFKATKGRAREGELTRTDTDQAKSRLYLGEAKLAEARADLGSSEATFEAVIGHNPKRLASAPPIRNLLPRRQSEAVSAGQQDNPLIIAATFRKEAAAHEVQTIRGELLPTVSLDAGYQRDLQLSGTVDRQDEASVELRFSMPLYNAGTTYSKIRQARAVLSQREYEVVNTVRDVKASVITAWQRRIAAHKRIRATHISVTAAEAALKGVKLESEVGERSVFDILDAQRDLVNARVDQVNAERDFIVSSFSLLGTIGRLSAEELRLNADYYDPDENYNRVRYSPAWTASAAR